MSTCNLKSLVKQKTCFRNPGNASCIDLILKNYPRSFQDSSVFETGISDFYKLTTTILKQYFPKPKPKIVNYRHSINFRNDEFRAKLDKEILKYDINNIKYQHSLNIFIKTLNKHTTMKIKYLRASQGNFMTKGLNKAIMKCSRLRNTFPRDRTEKSQKEHNKQINFYFNFLKKSKNTIFQILV